MIIVKIWGGLGNQLFQYSFGYNLSKQRNEKLILDTSYYENQTKHVGNRNFRLELLNLPRVDEIKYKRTPTINLLESKYINKGIRVFPKFYISVGNDTSFLKETRKKYISDIENYKFKNLYVDGYWQSSKYFSECKSELINMYEPNYKLSKEVIKTMNIINESDSVSVHIRRGDFTNKSYKRIGHYIEPSYYHKSISYIKNKLKNPTFFFFSDDIEWVKREFGESDDYLYINFTDSTHADIDDLMCMSKCKHSIISASTFSWWGAWLKESNDNNIIIAPNGNYFNEYFLESNWVKI